MEPKKLILRDELALERTKLANQRTVLAFSRTGLYLVVTAMAIFKFSKTGKYEILAWALVLIGCLVAITGIVNYFIMRKKIRKAYLDK